MHTEFFSFIDAWPSGVCHAATRHESAGKRPRPTGSMGIIEGRVDIPLRRPPRKGHPFILRKREVHAAIQRNLEAQSGARSHIGNTDAPFLTFRQVHQPHTGNLQKLPHALGKVRWRELMAEEYGHNAAFCWKSKTMTVKFWFVGGSVTVCVPSAVRRIASFFPGFPSKFRHRSNHEVRNQRETVRARCSLHASGSCSDSPRCIRSTA